MSEDPRFRGWRNPWIWGVLACLALPPLVRPLTRREPPAPAPIGQLPSFQLIDQDGRSFGTHELQGQVWIAGFFFTSCQSICPRLLQQMDRVADRYRDLEVPIRVVAISVDPETDTPARLKEAEARVGADADHWTFLTGPTDSVRALVTQGFMTEMGEKRANDAGMLDIAHTGRLAIVDGGGAIRGFYETDEQGLDEVFHRARHVLRDEQRARKAAN